MQQPFLGSINYFAFSYAPQGWQQCNGQSMPISQNQALFSLLGTMFGGNGTTTFNLPDLRGRTMVGIGSSSVGTIYNMGQFAGTENATMTVANMPAHTHAMPTTAPKIAASTTANSPNAGNNYPGPNDNGGGYNTTASGANLGAPTLTVSTAGSNLPFSILSPYLALTCAIATAGIYPSRN
jgi:microcystin-dependent protein